MKNTIKLILATASVALLAACGGGGGGGTVSTGPVASTNTFNVMSGWQRLVSTGFSKTYNVTGTCTGTMTITAAPATTATTFEGSSALSSNSVGSYNWTGCTPPSGSTTIVRYYNSNYAPVGRSVVGGDYGVFLTGAPTLPMTARVGDIFVIGTMTEYTNSTKTTSAGREDSTLLMEPDTATTAIANLISKSYNSSGTLTATEQNRYRVAADGSLTPISFDIQYANGSTVRIIGN
jgi:hypothetical protein